ALAQVGISAERKSIYDDLDALRFLGMDILMVKSRAVGYYVGGRDFEVPELKLLVDAVQSSKFITRKKSEELIRKIEGLASRYEAQLLQRQVYVTNRVKTMNESIYYHVDKIHTAIAENKKITFRYFEYTVDKIRKYKHDGKEYSVSPMILTWGDENYYLLGFDSEVGFIKHYRVDKMDCIAIIEEERDGLTLFEKLDMAQYAQRFFSMFGGEETLLKLRFHNKLIGVIIDRFGKDVSVGRDGEEHFTIYVTLRVSAQFFGWLSGFGKEAEIVSPPKVREEYFCHLLQAVKMNMPEK
ncbi:MAG: WYL domain-containing protein, partial [Oscillospiraceae bacterium]